MMKKSLRLAGVLFATALAAVAASALEPLGDEFQLNTMTTGPQFKPSVCRDASGNFVAVWGSFPDGGGPCQQCATTSVAAPFLPFTINGQRFDSVGEKVGSEFVVDTFDYDVQASYYRNPVLPAIGCAADGSFVVTWSRFVSSGLQAQTSGICFDDEDSDVFMQRYNSDGQAAGILQVNTDSDYGFQTSYRTAVGVQDDGDFVITWSSFADFDCFAVTSGMPLPPGDDGDDAGIFAKRFDSAGFAQGSEFQVNTFTTDGQYYPAVSASDDGFTVAWTSYGSDGDRFGVGGRRFDSSGVPLGTEFQVNTYTTGDQGYYGDGVSVARGDQGDFVVVWKSAEPCCTATTSANAAASGRRRRGERRGGTSSAAALNGPAPEPSTGVRGRLYDSSGAPAGDEFEVSDSFQYYYFDAPMVAVGGTEFLVVWDQPEEDDPIAVASIIGGDPGDVYGRRFARADASPIDSQFRIPLVSEYLQFQPDVASNGNDDFVIVWGSGYYLLGPLNATGAVLSGTDPRDPEGVFGIIGVAATTATMTATATATATSTDTPTPTASSTATSTPTPYLPDGVVCVDDSQCTSSFCRDGVCCATACDGVTEVCNLSDQLGICVEVAAPAPAVSPRGMLVAVALLAMIAFVGLLRLRRT